MIKNEITPNPQYISQIESWETIYSIANSNNNHESDIPEIDSYFAKYRKENEDVQTPNYKYAVYYERLAQQIQEINKANEKLQSEVDSYNKRIEQYKTNKELESALKFKIRMLIRNNSAILIKKYKQQNLERKNALDPIQQRLSTKPVDNLFKNINNVSTQIVNSQYENLKDRIEAIASQVNLPSGHNQAID